jgi:hypothetical protein
MNHGDVQSALRISTNLSILQHAVRVNASPAFAIVSSTAALDSPESKDRPSPAAVENLSQYSALHSLQVWHTSMPFVGSMQYRRLCVRRA